ncbi:hypothetical protein ACP4OV_002867 [Aristida adscensionis]
MALAVAVLLLPGVLTATPATPYPYGRRSDDQATRRRVRQVRRQLRPVGPPLPHGPRPGVLSASPLHLYVLWYGRWDPAHQARVRDFLLSLSDASPPPPSLAGWWATAALYDADQTLANVTRGVAHPPRRPAGARRGRLPADARARAYLVLTGVTAPGVRVCGFHYFTFPSLAGHTLPFAWVGHSGGRCADVCAYPFVLPAYMSRSSAAAERRRRRGRHHQRHRARAGRGCLCQAVLVQRASDD